MTAVIYTDNAHLWGLCSAYFEVYGHTVQRKQLGELAAADVVILDMPWRTPLPAVDCKLLVVISVDELQCPPASWFYCKPVDLDVMMDRILEFMDSATHG